MRDGAAVSLSQVDSALATVRRELKLLGLFGEASRLREVPVCWCPLPQVILAKASGFFISADDGLVGRLGQLVGYRAGTIYIPRIVLSQLWHQHRGSLRDILRHEFGHATAYHYPEIVRTPSFRRVFNGDYGQDEPDQVTAAADYVSEYAQDAPREDFAETFMVYVRSKGDVSRLGRTPRLLQKVQFVRQVAAQVAARG